MIGIGFLRRFCISGGLLARTGERSQSAAAICHKLHGIVCLASSVAVADNLNSTVILDSDSYAATELFDVYQNFLGRPVTDQTATLIAAALQQKYLDDGFAKPGYKILDGGEQTHIIRIRVLEASISRVDFSGDAGPFDQRLRALFGELPEASALRPDQVRDAIRQARRLPGLDLSALTAPDGERSGAFVLTLDSEFTPVEGNIKLSNRGTREIGRNLLQATLVGNGLFKLNNSSGLFLTSASDSNKYRGAGGYTIHGFGDHGASAQLQGSHTAVDIESDGIQLEQGRDLFSARLNRPLDRSLLGDASVWGKFEVDNLDVTQDGAVSREDRLRSMAVGVSTVRRSEVAVRQLIVSIEKALNVFGSKQENFISPDESRRPNFTITELHYVKSTQLSDAWTFRWDGFAQYSAQTLPSIKRFKVGGNRVGRGFEAAAISGDRGLAAKFEFRRRLKNAAGVPGAGSVYSFYDLGAAWKNDIAGRESAASAGVGFSLRGERLSGYLEAAKPLTHADADGSKDVGVFAELAFQF